MLSDKKNMIIVILCVGLFISLGYIISINSLWKSNHVQKTNTEIAGDWNTDSRLPLGSIFTTEDGTWMVIGQKPVSYVDDNFNLQSQESWTFDYYCVPYPDGCRSVYTEYENTALYNKSDIQKVLYVGKIDSVDEEYRNWIDNYDTTENNPGSETSHSSGALYSQAPCKVIQNLRLQGKTTSEIFGTNFAEGLLGEDLKNSGMFFSNYEWWNIMNKQGYTVDSLLNETQQEENK